MSLMLPRRIEQLRQLSVQIVGGNEETAVIGH